MAFHRLGSVSRYVGQIRVHIAISTLKYLPNLSPILVSFVRKSSGRSVNQHTPYARSPGWNRLSGRSMLHISRASLQNHILAL